MIQQGTVAHRLLRFFVENPGPDNARTVWELIEEVQATSVHQRMTIDLESGEGLNIVHELRQRPQDVKPQHVYHLPETELPKSRKVLLEAVPKKQKSTAAGGAPRTVKRGNQTAPTDPSSEAGHGAHPPAPSSAPVEPETYNVHVLTVGEVRRIANEEGLPFESDSADTHLMLQGSAPFTRDQVISMLRAFDAMPDDSGEPSPPRKESERIFVRCKCGGEVEAEKREALPGAKLGNIATCPSCGDAFTIAANLVPLTQGRLW